ncbi:inosine/uridine-preferring nucleoside hydrolase [Rhodotorula toruloides]|uniref:Inosine/uridine-preferring nucleoside hydrolase n=1 Tax=Rhodotorula toruloides TaxID=5286 RepID=A0A511KP26_RHOTO|nr:inosine/uridine-preferring nucleoside hydrolase [Rhodotorula toruloides]
MPHDEAPLPCIIDTDPGVDDVLALLLALSSPHLLILSITLTHGNCALPSALSNLQKLFYALERETDSERARFCNVDPAWRKRWGAGPIEVYLGSEGPIEGEAVTAKYFHGKDGLGDAATRHPDLTPPSSHVSTLFTLHASIPAVDGLAALLSRHPPQSIAYVALGPLTSLAQLHRATVGDGKMRESALAKFGVILSMGGTMDHPGNTSPVAEFNYFADPFAAQAIFSLALPNLYILPLDLTSYLTLPFALYASRIDSSFSDSRAPSDPVQKKPLTHFTSSFLERTVEIMRSFGGDAMELHDPTVVYCLIDWARNGRRRDEASGRGFGVDGEEGEVAPGWAWRHYDFEVETCVRP